MPVVAIIPVKSFRSAKGRLADALDTERRRRLSVALAGHVATSAEAADVLPLVVTSDAEVAEWATSAGFPTLADPGLGLNAAAATGVDWAIRARSSWLVIHSDLPLLTPTDVEAVAKPLESGGTSLAPSTDGGTSAIGGHGPFDFAYGVSSFHRHLRRLPQTSIVVRAGLALDIDSPDDLRTAITASAGDWLRGAIH
jgi:2-phospho-L-lactate guanylyltransferase